MKIEMKDIEQYLSDVREAVENDRYRIDRNSRQQDNIRLFLDYVINEAMAKDIILSLTAKDFSEVLQNEHKGYEYEQLYVFGKDVSPVSAYILFQITGIRRWSLWLRRMLKIREEGTSALNAGKKRNTFYRGVIL